MDAAGWKEVTYLRVDEDDNDAYGCLCPLCNRWFRGSEYLETVFKEPRPLLLANLITHYRHEHLHYDKNYGFVVHYKGYATRDEYRSDINERAKRQYARKCTEWLKANGFTVEDVQKLKGTTPKTVAVWKKKLILETTYKLKSKKVKA